MPNNPSEYQRLIDDARKQHLANIKDVGVKIKDIYGKAAEDIAVKAANSPRRSIEERWAKEYRRSLQERIRQMDNEMYDVVYQGLKRSSTLPAQVQEEFFDGLCGNSFRDVFASTPDKVLAEIISGGFYKDGKGLSERIWRATDTLNRGIDEIIQVGISAKKSARELAKDLEAYINPKAQRPWDWAKVYPRLGGKVDYNAQRLARTAINHSYWLANVKSCAANPYVTAMHWRLSSEHWTRQILPFGEDCCDDYAKHDEGLGKGNFKPENLPKPHPQCLCSQYGVITQSLEEIGAELGSWLGGAPNPKLDTWLVTYSR